MLTFKFPIVDSLCVLKFKSKRIILYLSSMVDLSITIYTCTSFFMFINKNLREAAFNYCTQWSGVDDQKIDRSINSIGAISHII